MSEAPSADLFKAIAALILFSIALVGGILPRRLRNVGSRVVSCLNTAAGGVFFASAMVRANQSVVSGIGPCLHRINGIMASVCLMMSSHSSL